MQPPASFSRVKGVIDEQFVQMVTSCVTVRTALRSASKASEQWIVSRDLDKLQRHIEKVRLSFTELKEP